MQLILRWIIGAVGLFLTVKAAEALRIGLRLDSGTSGLVAAFAVVVVLSLVNALIRPVVAFFFAGLNCLTLGLFSFVINALMFYLAGVIARELKLGFHVEGFIAALFGSVVLSLVTGVLEALVPEKPRRRAAR